MTKEVLLKKRNSLSYTIDGREYVLNLPDNCEIGELFDVCLLFAVQVKNLMSEKLDKVEDSKPEEDEKDAAEEGKE